MQVSRKFENNRLVVENQEKMVIGEWLNGELVNWWIRDWKIRKKGPVKPAKIMAGKLWAKYKGVNPTINCGKKFLIRQGTGKWTFVFADKIHAGEKG
jgi:hypothetical protein